MGFEIAFQHLNLLLIELVNAVFCRFMVVSWSAGDISTRIGFFALEALRFFVDLCCSRALFVFFVGDDLRFFLRFASSSNSPTLHLRMFSLASSLVFLNGFRKWSPLPWWSTLPCLRLPPDVYAICACTGNFQSACSAKWWRRNLIAMINLLHNGTIGVYNNPELIAGRI